MLKVGGGRSSTSFKIVNGKICDIKNDDQLAKVNEEKRVKFLESLLKNDICETDKRQNKQETRQLFNQQSNPILSNGVVNDNIINYVQVFKKGKMGMKIEHNLIISEIYENTQASTKGIQPGFIVQKINGQQIKNFNEFLKYINKDSCNTLEFLINTKDLVTKEDLIRYNENDDNTYTLFEEMHGITLTDNLTIVSITPNSEASKTDLKVGYTITHVILNDNSEVRVKHFKHYNDIISDLKKRKIPVTIRIEKVKNTLTQINEFKFPSPSIGTHVVVPGHHVIVQGNLPGHHVIVQGQHPRHHVIVPGLQGIIFRNPSW